MARPSRRATQHRLAGTLDVFPPADAPFGHDGPALGANLGNFSDVGAASTSRAASGRNGHIYWLQTYGYSRTLFELDPYTGQLRVQSLPPDRTGISSIAVASDGSVLIADSGSYRASNGAVLMANPSPAGIWRFKDGVLSKLAGFDRPVPLTVVPFSIYSWPPSEDGKGGAATFSYKLGNFCAGPNDTFYLLETGTRDSPYGGGVELMARRKISLDGTVETIDRASNVSIKCATNQRVFGRLTSAGTAYGDLVSGQVFSQTANYDTIPRYGFGDGLAIADAHIDYMITDLKSDLVKPKLWIQVMCTYNDVNCLANSDAHFQLDTMPYRMPMLSDSVVIDNNNYAYLRSGNALLRYKLPGKVQLN